MASKKIKLKVIQAADEAYLSQAVEDFLSQIENPETMNIQFEVAKTPSGSFTFFAFIVFDGALTKRAV